jgi:hypothetical protein
MKDFSRRIAFPRHGMYRLFAYGLLSGAFAVFLGGCNHSNKQIKLDLNPTFTVPSPGSPLPKLPKPSNGMQALERMTQAYKSANSMFIHSSATISYTLVSKKSLFQTTTIKYQTNPARLFMTVQDPLEGTNEYYADGSTIVHYSGLSNQYTRRSYTGGMETIAKIIDKESPQVFSPILFLMSGKDPLGVQTASMKEESYQGKPSLLVSGTLSPSYLSNLSHRIFGVTMKSTKGEYAVHLDPNTYLLMDSQLHFAWAGKVKSNGKVFAENPMVDIHEVEKENVVNPTYKDDTFRFTPPNKAQEIYIQSRSQLEQ